MNLLDELRELGVSVDEGVKRLGGNTAIYKKMLCSSFVKMMKGYVVEPDFDNENYQDVIEKAHAIKGAAGNLSVTPLYEAYGEVVNLLRNGQPEQAREVLIKAIPVQEQIMGVLEKYTEKK
ncbi:hypothetical protein C806_03475 [Lachnospiraceae bacterium 3-1]|nr:hypothetical protein C806_03475 [Lachnospiraceae bacterium 3-1]